MINVIEQTENYNRTNKYQQVKTKDLILSLENRGYKQESMSQVNTKNPEKMGFQKHLIRFSSKDLNLKGVTDSRPEIVLINSHDGSSSLKLMIGVYRFVCANGIICGDTFESYSIRHIGEIEGKIDAALAGVANYLPLVANKIKRFESIKLTDYDALELMRKSAALVLPNSCIDVDLGYALRALRPEDSEQNLWVIFNRIQERILNGGLNYLSKTETKDVDGNILKTTVARRTLRKIKAIDKQVKVNKALWDIAENFAA